MFCSSLRFCLTVGAIAVKSRFLFQRDGISFTLIEENVNCTENFICSLLFATKLHLRNMFTRGMGVFIFIVAYVWKCQKMSRTHRIMQAKFFQSKVIKGFSSEYTRSFS